jgi:hypothetical protein
MQRGRALQGEAGTVGGGSRPGERSRRREVNLANVAIFLRQYARKALRGGEPNDRGYSRQIEKKVKRMKPEELDRLLRDEDA